jgi:hypothetical protein
MSEKASKPIKNKNTLEDMGNSMTIESLFSTYILLDIFLSTELINKAKLFHTKMANRHAQEGLRQGYKLLLVATLDNYIDGIIRSPEIIGIEPDLDYRDYWAFTKGRGRKITRATARPGHHISKFVAKASSFIDEILTLETWESVEAFGDKTKSFRDCLHLISEKAYVASKGGRRVVMRNALLESSNMILWSNSGNPLPIAHMYTDYFISRKGDEVDIHSLDEVVRECDLSSGITRLDFSHLDPLFFPRPLPVHWALGYAFSLHESLKLLARDNKHIARLKSLDELVLSTKDWHDIEEYDRKIETVFGLPKIFRGYSYSTYKTITDADRQPLIAEVEALPSPERLLSIFGNRARIVERGFPGAFGSFECLLDGAIKRSKRTKEKAKVAIIVHKDRWGQEDYSTAIFMPAYGGGFISTNASMWWVFYLIGNNHSGGASHRWRLVFNKIKRSRKVIDLIVVHADEEEFYRYCEDPGYSRLNDAIVLTNRITSDVRGVFPELLLANMLTNMGCKTVRIGFKPKILKPVDGELDALGIKYDGNLPKGIILFESKGQATVDDELQKEINHFSDNVKTIQQNLASFCNELKLSYTDNVQIEATFISMDTLEYVNNINVPDNIKLWNYNDLVSSLKHYKVPRKYLELLKTIRVAVSM